LLFIKINAIGKSWVNPDLENHFLGEV